MKKHLLKSNKLIKIIASLFSIMTLVSVILPTKVYASSLGNAIMNSLTLLEDVDGGQSFFSDPTKISVMFVSQLVSYGRVIALFLILVAILIAAFRHMLNSATNPEKRAQTIQTFKRIFAGILVFLVLTAIVGLVSQYLDKGFAFIIDTNNSTDTSLFDEEYDRVAAESDLLGIIKTLIDVYYQIANGIIEMFMKSFDSSVEGQDYLVLIYDVYMKGGDVSKMKPFDEEGVEWTRLMSGYNALIGIAFLILIFVFVKSAIEFVLYAGNEKKLVEVKETWMRILYGVLLIISTPFLVRLLIWLFNYMTAALPVDFSNKKYDIEITYSGVLGSLANCWFITVKWNIFMAFYVRHVMIDLLTVSAPIVCATWAVNKKFKSFPLWLGELLSNIAMQFCYAVAFYIIILLSTDNHNQLYGLILVTVALQIAKFVKDSLQGYLITGAGINEEAVGSSIVGRVFGWGKKAKGKTKKTFATVGKISTKVDPKLKSKFWRGTYNASQIAQGKFGNIQFSRGKSSKDLKAQANKIQADINNISDDELREEAQEYYDTVVVNGGKPSTKKGKDDGAIFEEINNYALDAKDKASWFKEKKDELDNKMLDNSINKASKKYIGGPVNEGEYFQDVNDRVMDMISASSAAEDTMTKEQAGKELEETSKNVNFVLDHFMQNYVTEEAAVRNAELKDLTQTLHNMQILDAKFFNGGNKESIDLIQEAIAERLALQLAKGNGNDDAGIKIKISAKGLNELLKIQGDENYKKAKDK